MCGQVQTSLILLRQSSWSLKRIKSFMICWLMTLTSWSSFNLMFDTVLIICYSKLKLILNRMICIKTMEFTRIVSCFGWCIKWFMLCSTIFWLCFFTCPYEYVGYFSKSYDSLHLLYIKCFSFHFFCDSYFKLYWMGTSWFWIISS